MPASKSNNSQLPCTPVRHRSDATARAAFRTRLRLGQYVAEIVCETKGAQSIYHVLVQRAGSPAILGLSQELTFCEALDDAHVCLERMNQMDGNRHRLPLYSFGS